MSEPYVGEIRIFAGNFAPLGWLSCDGALYPISENETLYQLIGTTYGGDGVETFGVPDLRGRAPIHFGSGPGNTYTPGETGGVEQVTLSINQIPNHSHALLASMDHAGASTPMGNVLGQTGAAQVYRTGTPSIPMAAASIAPVGGSQPHENMQPSVAVNFIISAFGIFPSPT